MFINICASIALALRAPRHSLFLQKILFKEFSLARLKLTCNFLTSLTLQIRERFRPYRVLWICYSNRLNPLQIRERFRHLIYLGISLSMNVLIPYKSGSVSDTHPSLHYNIPSCLNPLQIRERFRRSRAST